MSLYPSFEDLKVDQLMRAQEAHESHWTPQPPTAPYPTIPSTHVANSTPAPLEKYANLYPHLDDYMGLQLNEVAPAYHPPTTSAVVPQSNAVSVGNNQMVAPLSSNSLGLARANVTHGIREILLCKDQNGKVGLRVQAINKGVFVILVQKNTPAAMAGLRFGDQILMINDITVAGYSMDKVHDIIKKSNPQRITMVVRDRPFERIVTVHKDSIGSVGFGFKNGKIINIVKDSSAARNGLLIEHNLLEVNGQNVVGLKDKEITEIFKASDRTITLTVMPSFVFDHLIKNTASSFIKKTMDHSIPEI